MVTLKTVWFLSLPPRALTTTVILKGISHPSQTHFGELCGCLPPHQNGVHIVPANSGTQRCLLSGKMGSEYKAFTASLGGGWSHFPSIQSSSWQPHNACLWGSREGAKGHGEFKQLSQGNTLHSSDRLFSREYEMISSNPRHFFFSHLNNSEIRVYLHRVPFHNYLAALSFMYIFQKPVNPRVKDVTFYSMNYGSSGAGSHWPNLDHVPIPGQSLLFWL